MRSDPSSLSDARSWSRRGRAVAIALVTVIAAAWVWVMSAAARTLSFEPNSDRALQDATDARLPAVAWGLVLAVAAVTLARVGGHAWLALLGLPGLVVAVAALLDPHGNGSALVLGLVTSLLSLGVAAVCSARARAHGQRP